MELEPQSPGGRQQTSHMGSLRRCRLDCACRRNRTHPVTTWCGECSRWQPQAGCRPHFGGDHVHTISPAVAQVRRTGFADETVAHSPASSLMVICPSAPSRSRCAAISALRPCLQGGQGRKEKRPGRHGYFTSGQLPGANPSASFRLCANCGREHLQQRAWTAVGPIRSPRQLRRVA